MLLLLLLYLLALPQSSSLVLEPCQNCLLHLLVPTPTEIPDYRLQKTRLVLPLTLDNLRLVLDPLPLGDHLLDTYPIVTAVDLVPNTHGTL